MIRNPKNIYKSAYKKIFLYALDKIERRVEKMLQYAVGSTPFFYFVIFKGQVVPFF